MIPKEMKNLKNGYKNWGTIIHLCDQGTANCRAEGQRCSRTNTETLWYRKLVSLESSLARDRSDPPSQVVKKDAGWCVENAQGLYRNRFKEVACTERVRARVRAIVKVLEGYDKQTNNSSIKGKGKGCHIPLQGCRLRPWARRWIDH